MGYSAGDFKIAADEAVNDAARRAAWGVFDSYTLHPADDPSDAYFFASAQNAEGGRLNNVIDLLISRYLQNPFTDAAGNVQSLTRYQPLKVPGLFLEFARLPQDPGLDEEMCTENNRAVVEDWVDRHGVLGLTRRDFEHAAGHPVERWAHQGGREDSVSNFVAESLNAFGTLRLFQAATSPDGPDVDFILMGVPERQRERYGQDADQARRWALRTVASIVEAYLDSCCTPSFRLQEDGEITLEWGFKNLLGAMWLQMMWLLTSTGNVVRRCARQGCPEIIAYEQPESPRPAPRSKGGKARYKPRRDKKFCSNSCRVRNFQQRKKRQ